MQEKTIPKIKGMDHEQKPSQNKIIRNQIFSYKIGERVIRFLHQ